MTLGFERRPESVGDQTVGYRFPHLELTATVRTNRNFRTVVSLSGVLNTGRTIEHIDSEIPSGLDSPEAAAAWVSYTLQSCSADLEPWPSWMELGQQNWHFVQECVSG